MTSQTDLREVVDVVIGVDTKQVATVSGPRSLTAHRSPLAARRSPSAIVPIRAQSGRPPGLTCRLCLTVDSPVGLVYLKARSLGATGSRVR